MQQNGNQKVGLVSIGGKRLVAAERIAGKVA
jgi:hypothetical protein